MLIKKMSLIGLSLVLLFCLTACNGGSDDNVIPYDVTIKVLNTVPYPLENAEVVIEGTTKYTDNYGLVTFENLEGECSYTISNEGYYDATGTITSDDADSVIFITLELVDETAPTVNITSPADGALLGDNDVTIDWTISDSSPYTWELYLGGATSPVATGDQDDSHTYTFDPASPDYFENYYGTVIFKVKAIDNSDNETTESIQVTIDTRPDLLPDSSSTGGYYPFELVNGQIVIYVKNQGNSPAGSSTTKVIFYKTDDQIERNISTPSLEPGESTSLTPIDIPSGVFNPDADFNIIVDFYDVVDEKDESNNEADCIIVG